MAKKTALDITQIALASRVFRSAIEKSLPMGSPIMDGFPYGACDDASLLLAKYLGECGLGTWTYCCGTRYRDGESRSHAWIEQDELIVDITADQFGESPDPVVVTHDREWHDQFLRISGSGGEALLDNYDVGTRERLTGLYSQILQSMLEI